MPINPLTGLEEDEIIQPPPSADAGINSSVKDYLMQKYNLAGYGDQDRQKLVQENQAGFGDKAQAALAAIGAGFMGNDAGAAGQSVLARQKGERDAKLSDFDKGRAAKIQEFGLNRDAVNADREDAKYGKDQELAARESDPNSQESKMANDLAKEMGYKGQPITAAQFKQFSPVMQKKYEIAEKRLDRQESRDERRFQAGIKMDEKRLVRDEKKKASLNEIEDRRRNIEDNLTLVEEMIKEDGTYEAFGSHNADLDRRVEMIATDMAKLADPGSVARPQEVESFKKGLVQAGATGMRNSTALDLLKNFRSELNSRADNAYKIRGIENPGAQAQREGAVDETKTAAATTAPNADAESQARQKRIAELRAKKGGSYVAK